MDTLDPVLKLKKILQRPHPIQDRGLIERLHLKPESFWLEAEKIKFLHNLNSHLDEVIYDQNQIYNAKMEHDLKRAYLTKKIGYEPEVSKNDTLTWPIEYKNESFLFSVGKFGRIIVSMTHPAKGHPAIRKVIEEFIGTLY